MTGLSDSERISLMRSAVLAQSTRVTDRRTDLAWHIRAIAYAVARKNLDMRSISDTFLRRPTLPKVFFRCFAPV